MWIKTKIKGSTLTEVIIALVLLSVLTTIIFTVMVRAGNYHTNRRIIMMENHMQHIIENIKNREHVPEIIEYPLYTISISDKAFNDFKDCRKIQLTAKSPDGKIIQELTVITVIEPLMKNKDKIYYEHQL